MILIFHFCQKFKLSLERRKSIISSWMRRKEIVWNPLQCLLTLAISGFKHAISNTRMLILTCFSFTYESSIQIGSWQLDSTRIKFVSNKIHTKDLMYSSTWHLLGVYTNDELYSSSRYPYLGLTSHDVYFHVVIKRKSLYFMLTFVPCFILNVATLLAFFVTNAIVVQVNLCIYNIFSCIKIFF